jgi:hypothetical protein
MSRFIVGVLGCLALGYLGCHDQACRDDLVECEAWCTDQYAAEVCVDTSGSLTPTCDDCGGETCALTQVCCICFDANEDETFEFLS